ncbi:MAG: serine protease [Vicinamibacterales bacterium]
MRPWRVHLAPTRPAAAAGLAAALVLLAAAAAHGQGGPTLRITVTVENAGRPDVPVPRHALLVSDDPPTATPRRVVTGADGAVAVRLAPGRYVVESDQPLALAGRAYQWRQEVEVVAGRETTLALTAANAEVASGGGSSGVATSTDVVLLWQDSIVRLWTPTAHASGFLADARGLVVTSRQAIGDATAIEVQLTPTVKVRGTVLVADRDNDVVVLGVDPDAAAGLAPLPLACDRPLKTPLANGQEVAALGLPILRGTDVFEGDVQRVASRTMIADLRLRPGSVGGPVFGPGGDVIGITSLLAAKESDEPDDARIVRRDAVCEVVAAAEAARATTAAPDPTRLPVEPARTLPVETLQEDIARRTGSLNPYQVTAEGFDVSLVTPASAYAGLRASMDFANWTDYVADAPSVLLVRVTPKREEGFWAKVARGLVMTQGVALPPIKRFVSGFTRLRAFCGTAEVTPIHPFLIERRISATDAIHEGLYVFDPDAFGPHCRTARLELFSDKTPPVADVATLNPATLDLVWRDFAAYRALK